ncbi:MAG: acetyl-CoA synthase subunit delta [Oscillospiraceae bacterium]
MSFVPKKQAFNAKINAVTLGTGEKAVVLGGQNVLPFYTFDAPIENAPKIGVEISDLAKEWTAPALKEFYAGCETMADYAKKAETMPGADFLVLHFESADPNGVNRSVEECVADAKAVADVVTMPIAIMGCKNVEKDGQLFSKIAEALQGKNIVVLSAREEDYKAVGASVALAYGQKVGAESADDINLAKQLNIMLKGLGVAPESIVMNVGTAAVGYGYEYVASTLDRVRALRRWPSRTPTCRCLSSLPPLPTPGASRNLWYPKRICPNGAARRSGALIWKLPPPPPTSPAAPTPL